MRTFILMLATAVVAAATATTAGANRSRTCMTGCITEYQVPTPIVYNGPFGIARGSGGNMWFGDQDAVGRVDRAGHVTMFTVPTAGAGLGWVTPVGDNVWFTERFTDKIGSIDPRGRIAEYAIPTPDSTPQGLVEGPDGALWFTEQDGNAIGRLSSSGTFSEFPVPTPDAAPLGLTVGPDHALWFVERDASQIGRIDMQGHVTEFPLAPGLRPQRITLGNDGALWFSELGGNAIGRITVSGELREYPLAAGSLPVGITARRDGLWFSEAGTAKIAHMGYDGVVQQEWSIPTTSPSALQIATGPRGTIWFTEQAGNKVGRLAPKAGDAQ